MNNVIDVLKERGFIDALSNEQVRELAQHPLKVYCGFDPTADSLHVGNLVAIMGLAWFQRFGHTPVAIVGGATGLIGDPSGKSAERQFLDEQILQRNLEGIKKNLEIILDFDHATAPALILNNFDWFKDFSFIQFIRQIGKLFRLGPMLAKESVRARLQTEEGMSFTEFCYQLLQGYDFLHLYQTYGVSVQLGGSDQWGNITAGIDLIRKVTHTSTAFGITFPLLTKSDGQKFGKSEKGAIWLSPEKLSTYEFYQYFIRTEDADVIKLMRMLTFMDMSEIAWYEKEMQKPDYEPRAAQKKLAEEVTRIVHGQKEFIKAFQITEIMSPGTQTKLNSDILEHAVMNLPSCELTLESIQGKKMIDLLVEVGLQTSKNEARRLIRNGGVYLNNDKIEDENFNLNEQILISDRFFLLAAGKKNKLVIRIKKE